MSSFQFPVSREAKARPAPLFFNWKLATGNWKPLLMADGIKGWARLIRATKVSYLGLGWALREEEAFRIEAGIGLVMAPLALWFGRGGVQKAVLLMSLLIVLITELLNTGIEVAIDRIGTERHVLSGRAKDLGSAAVHLSLLQVPLVWGLVLFG